MEASNGTGSDGENGAGSDWVEVIAKGGIRSLISYPTAIYLSQRLILVLVVLFRSNCKFLLTTPQLLLVTQQPSLYYPLLHVCLYCVLPL